MTTVAERRIMIGLAAFAMAWAIVRAHVQAITIDEAVSYTNFIRPAEPAFWTAHANNHLLNSMLAWCFTRACGTSHLATRSGALIGAAIYIVAAYFLCALIAKRIFLRAFLFICLVFNPFVFDFLVAGRGYGLASGLLLCAICLVAYALESDATAPDPDGRRITRACVGASLCIALSFLGNFSFAFVDAAAVVMLYLWASRGAAARTRFILAAACFLPGLFLAGAIAGPILLQWERGELNYGATSLSGTFQSLYESSFYRVDPVAREMVFFDIPKPSLLLLIVGALALWRESLVLFHWRSLRAPFLAAIPLFAVAAALTMHWTLFHFMRIPLPKDRTGIYIVVLVTLFVGIVAGTPIPTRAGEMSRRGLTLMIIIMGSYFLLCLRVSYFKEWEWDSDTDRVYAVLASYNHQCGLRDIAPNWRYDASLNYYRNTSARETFSEFPHLIGLPSGKRAYVLYRPDDDDFLMSHGLNVVYQTSSGAAIALDSGIAPLPGETPCPLTPPDQSK